MKTYCPTVLFGDSNWCATAAVLENWLAGRPTADSQVAQTRSSQADECLANKLALVTRGNYGCLIELARSRQSGSVLEELLVKYACAVLGDSYSANDLVAQVSFLESQDCAVSAFGGWVLVLDAHLRMHDRAAAAAALSRLASVQDRLARADRQWATALVSCMRILVAEHQMSATRKPGDLQHQLGEIGAFSDGLDPKRFARLLVIVGASGIRMQQAHGARSQAWFSAEKQYAKIKATGMHTRKIGSVVTALTAELRLLAGDAQGAAGIVGTPDQWTDSEGYLSSVRIGLAGLRSQGAIHDSEGVKAWASSLRNMHALGLVPVEAVPVEVSAWEAHVSGMKSRAMERTGRAISLWEANSDCHELQTAALRGFIASPTSSVSMDARLTRRERQVAELLTHRMSNREIADHLGVSIRTAEHHVANVLQKLGITSRRDLPLIS